MQRDQLKSCPNNQTARAIRAAVARGRRVRLVDCIHPLLAFCLLFIFVANAPDSLHAQTPSNQNTSAAKQGQSNDEIQQLVQQLADSRYIIREQAEQKLLQIGGPAVVAITAVQSSGDVELRLRARRILKLIKRSDFENRLQAFISSNDPNDDFGLAGWNAFREITGHEKANRKFFVELHRNQTELMDSLDKPSLDIRRQIQRRISNTSLVTPLSLQLGAFLLADLSLIQQEALRKQKLDPAPKNTLAAIAANRPTPRSGFGARQLSLYDRLIGTPTIKQIKNSDHKASFDKLLTHWLEKAEDSRFGFSPRIKRAELAVEYQLAGMLDTVIQAINNEPLTPILLAKSIRMIGNQGTPKHIESIEPFLSNQSDLAQYPSARVPNQRIVVRVSDVALASMIQLAKQDYQEFGFEGIENNDQQLPLELAGFLTNKDRAEAIEKWQIFRSSAVGKTISGSTPKEKPKSESGN